MQLFGLNITRVQNPAAIHIKEGHPKTGTWIKLGQSTYALNRDITGQNLFDTNDRAYKSWLFNPFVKRITEVWVNYVVGSGLTFRAKDERVQEIVDEYLAYNKIHLNMRQRARETYLFGELAAAPKVNTLSGRVRLGFVDPLIIVKVHLDPFDGDRPVAIEIRTTEDTYVLPLAYIDESGNAAEKMPELYGSGRPIPDKQLDTLGKMVGRAFMLRFNTVIGAQRGATDLLPILDWCGATEDVLWMKKESLEQQLAVVGTIEIQGATPKQLNDYRNPESPNYVPPPRKYDPNDEGSWAYSNEKIKFTFNSPDIKAGDMETIVNVFKSLIQIGSGNPAVVFGQADETTWASAKETTSPFYQMMDAAQQHFCYFWEETTQYAVDQERIFGNRLEGVTDTSVKVTGPSIAVDDKKLQSEIARAFTDTVVAWKVNGAIDNDQFIELIKTVAAESGLPIKEVATNAMGATAKESWEQKTLRRIAESSQ